MGGRPSTHERDITQYTSRNKAQLTDTSRQTAKVVAGNDDTGFAIRGAVELIEPVFILKNAPKNPLIIAEQHKCYEATNGDAYAYTFAAAKPGLHDD